jgi:cysteine desulfurase
MGIPSEWALGALRCSLGRNTSDQDIDDVLDVLPAAAERIRAMSPGAVTA